MARLIKHLTILVAAGMVTGALVASPAVAAPTWQPVTNLFTDLSAPGGSAFSPDVEVDDAGNATALWSRYDGSGLVVQVSTRPAGGTWSTPVDLAKGRSIWSPQLAVDPAGNATAVWRSSDVSTSVVQAATRPVGGTWSAPVELSVDTSVDLGQKPELPQIDVDADGTATAVWSHDPGSHQYVVQTATREPGGAWSPPADLSAAGTSARTPQVAVAPSGAATVVWATSGGQSVAQSTSRTAAGVWGAPATLSAPSVRVTNPDVAVDGSGAATAVWNRLDGSYATEVANRPVDGPWSAASALSSPGQDTFDTPQVASAGGRTMVVWQHRDGDAWVVAASERTSTGWAAPQDLSKPGRDHDAWDPQVVIDPEGNATAVWSRDEGPKRVVQAARAVALDGRGWSRSIDLSVEGSDAWHPQVAVDPAGNATTAWSLKASGSWTVQSRGLDTAGPVVTDLTVAGAGKRRTYAVTAHDAWSRVARATWHFADGTTATGTKVTHTDRGTRPVRVTVTDRVGNATACRWTGTYTCRRSGISAPSVHRARLSDPVVRASGGSVADRRTTVTMQLTASADVRVVLSKRGEKSVRLTKRLRAGMPRLVLRSRVTPHRVLAPGRWTVRITARNEVGTSRTRTLRLRVVR